MKSDKLKKGKHFSSAIAIPTDSFFRLVWYLLKAWATNLTHNEALLPNKWFGCQQKSLVYFIK